MRTFVIAVLAMGCADGTNQVDADTEETADSGTTMNTPECQPETPPADSGCKGTEQLQATVLDGAGQPLGGAKVRFCRAELCLIATSDVAGEFCIPEAVPGWHAFEVRGPRCSEGYAISYVPVTYDPDEQRTFEMVVPNLGDATALPATPTEIEAATGIFVTIGADSLTTPKFEEDATEIAGVRLTEAQFPTVDLPGTPMAMWYLSPFEYSADPGLPVRFANDLGLEDGTTLELWIGSYKEQNWLDGGTVTVKGDWIEGTDSRIPVTSTVLLQMPEAPTM